MKLTQKQEKFARNLFVGMNQAEAYSKAGYACKALTTTTANASRLAKNANVIQKLIELRAQVESNKIMSVIERKERLSEIARANLTQFMELGKDGSWVNLGAETPTMTNRYVNLADSELAIESHKSFSPVDNYFKKR